MDKKDDLKEALDSLFVLDLGEKLKEVYFGLYRTLITYSIINVKIKLRDRNEDARIISYLTADLLCYGKIMKLEIDNWRLGRLFDKRDSSYKILIWPELKRKGFFGVKSVESGDLEAKITAHFSYKDFAIKQKDMGWDNFFQLLSQYYNLYPDYVACELKSLSKVPNSLIEECKKRISVKKSAEDFVKSSMINFHKGNLTFLYQKGDNDSFKKLFAKIEDEAKVEVVKLLLKQKSNKELDNWLSNNFASVVENAGRENFIGSPQ